MRRHPDDPPSRPGRPVLPDTIWVPEGVEIDGEHLVWRANKGIVRSTDKLPGSGLLESFLELRDGMPRHILGFAKRWGPLGFNLHDLPTSRSFPWRVPRSAGFHIRTHVFWPTGEYRESLGAWRAWAAQAHSILRISTRLQGGALGRDEDWANLTPGFGIISVSPGASVTRELLEMEWSGVVFVLRQWIADGNVRPNVSERGGGLRLSLSGDRLLGALAVQLMFAASRRRGIYVCTECGKEFRPLKAPPAERRHFCAKCRKNGAPERHAAKDYYRRNRAKIIQRRARKRPQPHQGVRPLHSQQPCKEKTS